MENLSWVPSLGTPAEWLPPNLAKGTHGWCIRAEAMRPWGVFDSRIQTMPKGRFIFFNSFPDILPEAGRTIARAAMGIFVRGEFVTLRAIGGRQEALPLERVDHEKVLRIVNDISLASPTVIYYRMMDYNTDEFDFIANTPHDDTRGMRRILLDNNLLQHELEIIRTFQNNGKKVRVVLPYVTSPEEQDRLKAIVAELHPDQIGVMVERADHIRNIALYKPVDFHFPGPSDLSADLQSIARGEYREGDRSDEIIELVRRLSQVGYDHGTPELVTCKILVGKVRPAYGQTIYNALMPNQLISQVPLAITA